MSDNKVDDGDGTPPPKRTLKLKGPRIERPPAAKASLPGKPVPTMPPPPPPPAPPHEERPNFLTRIDQIKRQMQADMDALADPRPPFKKRT